MNGQERETIRRLLNALLLHYDTLPSWGEREERGRVEEWIARSNAGEEDEVMYADVLALARKRNLKDFIE